MARVLHRSLRMRIALGISIILAASAVRGHDHGKPTEPEISQGYAERHMAAEHHIDSFDLPSFFRLHDLNSDGVWDREEIEAIYGVHHVYAQKRSKDDIEHQEKADRIVKIVLSILDKNQDGKVSIEEFQAAGLAGLPNFDDLGAEGHHYDVESEFFLHHEEQFHSTPETQTDESYTHPEDVEHFANHRDIELKEAEKEAKFQGITVQEVLDAMLGGGGGSSSPGAGSDNEHPDHGSEAEQIPPSPPSPPKPKITRNTPPEKLDPSIKYADAARENDKNSEWGQGSGGYKTPKSPADKLRKNLPYKYKFRRNWGDF